VHTDYHDKEFSKMKHNEFKHPKYDKEADVLFKNTYIERFNFDLYHWTKSTSAYKIVHSKNFRMTNAYYFKDTDEFVRGMKYIIDTITMHRYENAKYEIFKGIRKELESILELSPEFIPYVACFTANKYNTHLRDNYGEKGKGGLFKITPTRLSIKSTLTFIKVIYDRHLFEMKAKELLDKYADTLTDYLVYRTTESNEAFRHIVPLLMRDIFILAISYKDYSYRQEEEYRFINFCLKGTPEYRNHPYLIFPSKYYNFHKIN
jgi:hypothetical protein